MSNTDTTQHTVERIHFEWRRFVNQQAILPQQLAAALNFRVLLLPHFEEMLLQIHGMVAARKRKDAVVKFPANWVEALKDRWFPAWARDRWPVRYTTHVFTAWDLYPEANIPDRMGQRNLVIEHTFHE